MMANRYSYKESQLQQQAHTIQSNVPGFSGRNIWPQQQQQQQLQQQTEEQRQKEYLKQQQKLRLMSAGLRKQPVSADKLIENLLEKEDTFRPKVSSQVAPPVPVGGHQIHGRSTGTATVVNFPQACSSYAPVPVAHTSVTNLDTKQGFSKRSVLNSSDTPISNEFSDLQNVSSQSGVNTSKFQLPSWICPPYPSLPVIYRQIWMFTGNDKGFVDTSKILPVLLTSGLPTDVLGYIWGLANRKVAGQLTEEELYIVLALVAVAQSGCAFNSLNILGVLPQAPIPSLNFGTVNATVVQEKDTSGFQLNKNHQEQITLPMDPVTIVDSDDFSEFQSAVFEPTTAPVATTTTTTIDTIATINKENTCPVDSSLFPSETKCLPDVSVNQKFPSVLVMSNSGRGIGSRLANHSLGTPRQTKARHHKHHHHHHHRSHHNNSVPMEDEFSDFQQAKHVGNEESSDTPEIFAKCVTKPVQGKTFVLKESAIRAEKVFDEYQQSPSSPAEINASIPGNLSVTDVPQAGKPKSEVKSVTANKELMSVEEDKYSALRALSFASAVPSPDEEDHNLSDDFGDFLSAELPPAVTSSTEVVRKEQINSGNQVPVLDCNIWPSTSTTASQNVEFSVDDWGSFESAPPVKATSSVPIDSFTNGVESSKISSETIPALSSSKGDLDFASDALSWDLNIAVTQTAKDIENWKLSDSNGCGNIGEFEGWNIDSGARTVEKDSGLNFLGKIYERPTGLDDVKMDLFASRKEHTNGNSTSLVIQDNDDEFGDFIGSEAWSTEEKYSKDILFDTQSGLGVKETMFDNQSVSSLELPPLALSRHGSLPSLDLKIFPQSGEKTNGQRSWDSPSQGAEHQVHEWCRCVQGCLQLLQAAHTIFSSISSDEVLLEVLNAPKGRDYLSNLLEVYGIFQRVRYSANHMMADSKQLEMLFTSLSSAWSNLEQYYTKAKIAVDRDNGNLSVENQGSSSDSLEHYVCGICLNNIGNDLMDQDSNNCHLEYGGQVYHASCANLWVNCVDCSLPSLTLL